MDLSLLKDEGIGDVDAFISLTKYDQLNLFSCLIGKYLGASKTISRVENLELIRFFEDMGIDIALSPKISAAEHVMRFIRMGGLKSLIILPTGQAEIIELLPTKMQDTWKDFKGHHFTGKILFLIIVRDNKLIIPRGDDIVQIGDKVIISAKVEKLKNKRIIRPILIILFLFLYATQDISISEF